MRGILEGQKHTRRGVLGVGGEEPFKGFIKCHFMHRCYTTYVLCFASMHSHHACITNSPIHHNTLSTKFAQASRIKTYGFTLYRLPTPHPFAEFPFNLSLHQYILWVSTKFFLPISTKSHSSTTRSLPYLALVITAR